MSASIGPRAVTNGLILELDAANPKSLFSINKNLFTAPEDFTNVNWPKGNCTILANAITAPDGTLTADALIDDTTNGEHLIYQGRIGSNETMTASCYMKAGTKTRAYITFSNFLNYTAFVIFDLSNGTIVSTGSNNADYTNISGTITPVGNGWYRCSTTATKGSVNTSNNPTIAVVVNSSSIYAGDNTPAIYLWGAQLEYGSVATDYYPVNASKQPSNNFSNLISTTTIPNLTQVEVLLVGGGGGGGYALGGGGGGGGVVYMPAVSVIPGTTYSMVVGAGGAQNTTGGSSTAFGATAAGGGGSAAYSTGQGKNGGSGGGASATDVSTLNYGGQATGSSLGPNSGTIYGNPGGSAIAVRTGTPTGGAGGGGAGGRALDVNSNSVVTAAGQQANGGPGIPFDITGTMLYYGGGGGGGAYYNGYAGNGGIGGGGAGSCTGGVGVAIGGGSALNSGGNGTPSPGNGNAAGGNGGDNTGGGGGGGAWNLGLGGTGGSGVIVVRYPLPVRATGGTITIVGNYAIHMFTSGTSSFNVDNTSERIANNTVYTSTSVPALVFNGVNNYVSTTTLGNYGSRMANNGVCIEFAFKSNYTAAFSQFGTINTGINTLLALNFNRNTSDAYAAGNTSLSIRGDGGSYLQGTMTANIYTGNYFIVCTTREPNTNVINFYVNGEPVSVTYGASNNVTSFSDFQYPFTIGAINSRGSIAAYNNCEIPFFKIYNRALTPDEVKRNFNAVRGRFAI